MRTTVDINPDLLERVRKLADAEGVSFKEALNRVIMRGLRSPAKAKGQPVDLPVFNLGLDRFMDVRKALHAAAELEDAEMLRVMRERK